MTGAPPVGYVRGMLRHVAPFLALVLLACPRPKEEQPTDSVADDTGTSEAAEPAKPNPGTPGDGDGDPALSCEDELAEVKAKLAACEAAATK